MVWLSVLQLCWEAFWISDRFSSLCVSYCYIWALCEYSSQKWIIVAVAAGPGLKRGEEEITETWDCEETGQVYEADYFLEQKNQDFLVTEILEVEVIAETKEKKKIKATSFNVLDVCHSSNSGKAAVAVKA